MRARLSRASSACQHVRDLSEALDDTQFNSERKMSMDCNEFVYFRLLIPYFKEKLRPLNQEPFSVKPVNRNTNMFKYFQWIWTIY